MRLDPRSVARALGGESSGTTVLCPGPGHSPKDRSLAVRLDAAAPDGFLLYSHAGDDWKACRDHVRQLLGIPDWEPGDEQNRTIPAKHIDKWDLAAIAAEADTDRPLNEDELLRVALARGVWDEAQDPRRTLAERYLNSRRLDLTADLCGSVLRFHSRCPWRNENTGKTDRVPALIAAFRNVEDHSITGIHRIRLNPDGTKYDRRMLGIVHQAAVKLDPTAGDSLAIGEGVETAMAARQLGISPAWALGSVGAISFFPVIEGVQRLRIMGEAGTASEQAARICCRRWRRAGRRVFFIPPDDGCSDLNDVLVARLGAAK